MRKLFPLLFASFLSCFAMPLCAGVTTYTFSSKTWSSTVNGANCDGVTDGWICNQEADSYNDGRYAADGRLYSRGVGIIKGVSGAGATSVVEFAEVRRITVNFCQNSSKGKGVIYVQVGDNTPDSIVVTKPAVSGEGVYNRDSVIVLEKPLSGKITFRVTCSENAVYMNSLSVRSASGGTSVFTTDTYRLVTDLNQLQDSDQVILGVHKEGVNYIMGYFDEWESVNNIHAIRGRYSSDRSQVEPDERAIYTLRITELNGAPAYVFQDELRYEEAYLVASGGQTKNRLALWTDVVDGKTYGNYGFWNIEILDGGEAVITNLGNSKAKIIQYNASNNPTLFACYAERSQTPVCLYRRVGAIGDVEAIAAPLVNFGTTIAPEGARTIEVNANRLTEDIHASLTAGTVFSLSSAVLDRDGETLTVRYNALETGHYTDTLVLRSGKIETRVAVLLNRIRPVSVREAVQQEDYTMLYLNDVVVTKKYDNYIYVRDESGSMLLFDRGNGETGKRYGAGLKTGDRLSGVTGRFINYFGVPEISPSEQFAVSANGREVLPEQAGEQLDSADVCRYMLLDTAVVTGRTTLEYKGKEYKIENKFNLPSLTENCPSRLTVIVSYDWDVVTLYVVSQEVYSGLEGLEDPSRSCSRKAEMFMQNGVIYIRTEKGTMTLTGKVL